MARRPREASSMVEIYPAIRDAVRGIREAENQNFDAGIHRLGGKTDAKSVRVRTECYHQRERKLSHLRTLTALALPAGIRAGFSGEHVVERLNALLESVENAAYWNEKSPREDQAAWFVFDELFDQVIIDLEHLAVWSVADAALTPTKKKPLSADATEHSPDYRSITWFGQPFHFTARQAACVEILWQAWENGTPDVSQQRLQADTETESDLRHLFRKQPAWRTIIVPGETKGTLRLQPPGDAR